MVAESSAIRNAAALEAEVHPQRGAGAAQVDVVLREVVVHARARLLVADLAGQAEIVAHGNPQAGRDMEAGSGPVGDEGVGHDLEIVGEEVDELALLLVLVEEDVGAGGNVGREARAPPRGKEADGRAEGNNVQPQVLEDEAAVLALEVHVRARHRAPVTIEMEADLEVIGQVEAVLDAAGEAAKVTLVDRVQLV